MSILHVGRGSCVVEWPEDKVLSELVMFRRDYKGGQYENLFSMSSEKHTLVTMPGFAKRIERVSDDIYVRDERMKMPDPDMDAALNGLHHAWAPVVEKAIKADGGVVSIPHVLGSTAMEAALLRAYPRDRLLERGTPISVIACKDNSAARDRVHALRQILPDREIGVGPNTDSEDIIVVPYSGLSAIPRHLAGVFVGEDLDGSDFIARAEGISGIRAAARWGIVETPAGGPADIELSVEGLFGPVCATATYDDGVKAGIAAQITVCWLPCPRPTGPLGPASEELAEAQATVGNMRYVQMVADIMMGVKCTSIMYAEHLAILESVSKLVPAPVVVHRKMLKGARETALDNIYLGSVQRAFVTYPYVPWIPHNHVAIVGTCKGGRVAGLQFPWRAAARPGEKAYMVDFLHPWDLHNGRPGWLARNDESRKKRYEELGFNQLLVGDVTQLPFV